MPDGTEEDQRMLPTLEMLKHRLQLLEDAARAYRAMYQGPDTFDEDIAYLREKVRIAEAKT